ncbi:unnamed protein product [Linum trigynum]|uniref:Uncharacterized protein n=1 Tax=Linum trigynum TaxID=586398 RepID=A0AAV2C738_9ROSI
MIPPPATYFEKDTFSQRFTYSDHPVACAVAIEALKIYRERDSLACEHHCTKVPRRTMAINVSDQEPWES